MKIAQIIPGTGGSFYCVNCVRDGSLVRALRQLGHEVTMIPLYLPLSFAEGEVGSHSPLFFGAISTYLIEKFPPFAYLPTWINRMVNSRPLLKFAAHKADSTRAAGLEEMTLSMLRGEEGHQAHEIRHLVDWIRDEIRPDVIYLANALLLGLAKSLKTELDLPVVCALEDEDIWLEDMEPGALEKIWQIMEVNADYVDTFVPVSDYYNRKIQKLMHIPPEKLSTVHLGIDLDGFEADEAKPATPVIGYLSRMTESLGLGTLVDAFIILRKDPRFSELRLKAIGGVTSDDRGFMQALERKLEKSGLAGQVDFLEDFDAENRIEFLRSITVLSVPMQKHEAFGIFLLEALAHGVLIVQPKIGAFPEVVELTGGGLCFEPNTPEQLAESLAGLLSDTAQLDRLGKQGQQKVFSYFNSTGMANRILKVFEDAITT